MDPVFGASAATSAARKALGSSKQVEEMLLEEAKGTREFKRAAKALAVREETKQIIRTRLWQPWGRLFGVPAEDFIFAIEEELADRLEGVPEEDVVAPAGSVASPTITGLRATIDEPQLRNLYLNLLANASDRNTADRTHPSFAYIISQLSAAEAVDLALILADRPKLAIVEFQRTVPEIEGYLSLATNVLDWNFENSDNIFDDYESLALYVDNWQRLGLVEAEMTASLTRDGAYDYAGENNPYRRALEEDQRSRIPDATVSAENSHGILNVTALGRRFHDAVIAPRARLSLLGPTAVD